MRRVLTFAFATTIALAAYATAQTAKPNFAGSWTLVPESFKPGDTLFMTPEMTIAQDEKTITVTFSIQPIGEIKTVYKLDGSDSPNTLSMGGPDVPSTSKLTWDDRKLTIKTSFRMSGQSVDTSMTWWLDSSARLQVETTRPDFQKGGTVTTKAAYTKKS